jgi:hypothetical protein
MAIAEQRDDDPILTTIQNISYAASFQVYSFSREAIFSEDRPFPKH